MANLTAFPNPDAPQPVAPQTESGWAITTPKRAAYVGAMLDGDAGTLLGPMRTPKPGYPGSGVPGQAIECAKVPSARGLGAAAPTPGLGGRRRGL